MAQDNKIAQQTSNTEDNEKIVFRSNILIIRETIRMLFQETPDKSVETVYEYLGLSTKDITYILEQNSLSKDKYKKLISVLHEVGFYKNNLRNFRTCPLSVPNIVTDIAHHYFGCENAKIQTYTLQDYRTRQPNAIELIKQIKEPDVELALANLITTKQDTATLLRERIRLFFIAGEKDIARLVLCCYKLMYYATLKEQGSLNIAQATLRNFLDADTSSLPKKNELVIDILKDFSPLSSFSDKKEKSFRDIITETQVLLSVLLESDISAENETMMSYASLLNKIACLLICSDK